MARPSSSSAGPRRLLRLSYYLRRPMGVAAVSVFLLCTMFMMWDRRALVEANKDAVEHLEEQNSLLRAEMNRLRKFLREKLPMDLDQPHVVYQAKRQVETHNDEANEERRNKVKAAMLHAWTSYEKYAWGFDELQPQTRNGANDFGGLGATIVDSLDTLYIMGFKNEFQKARDWVSTLDFNKNYDASTFETTIRVVGGLISAYDLSNDKIFLTKAREIADRLLPAWDTPTGIPYTSVNLANGYARNPGWTGGASVLADLATEQVEFIALSQRTGDPKYQRKVEKVIDEIKKKIFPEDGLVPIYVNPVSATASNKVTFGAMGDSFYEYLLKVWILGNKTEEVQRYRDMWEKSMEGLTTLIRKSSPSSYSYIAERYGSGSYVDKMDELACFTPGMLALGADASEKGSKYMELAKELARTCYNFYRSTPTGLAGENYEFRPGQDMAVGTSWNILRPETVESLMYLWRTTGDKIYQEWGWQIFEAFEKNSRVESGYVGLRDVRSGEKDNKMQSFFLAETLKYLYLLFSPPSLIPLDEWVFNTEAHPIRIVQRGPNHGRQQQPRRFGKITI